MLVARVQTDLENALQRWLKEPLLHFIVLGALIFLAYGLLGDDVPGDDEIVVTRGQQAHLVTTFTRTWQRPPTPQEFDGLVRDWIRQEIAYREGQAMGLDTDDTVIRRRLRQKLELLAEDVVSLDEPTEAELQAFLEAHPEDYVREPVITLRQVYFSPDHRGDAVERDAQQALVLLSTDDPALDPAGLGDPLSLPHRLDGQHHSAVVRLFGGDFAEAVFALAPGAWRGPVRSGYGLHLVQVESHRPGGPLTLEQARAEVLRDLEYRRQQAAIDELYDRLAETYTITVEAPADVSAGP